jgi:hypothetical protein
VFEKGLMRKFVHKMEEVTGGWRMLRDEEIHKLCF